MSELKKYSTKYANGQVEIEYYYDADGRKQGDYTRYHRNGNVHIVTTYVNNKQVGEYKAYRASGKIHFHGCMMSDARHGEVRMYGHDGVLRTRHFYVMDEIITSKVLAEFPDEVLSEEDKLMIALKWGIPCLS